MPASIEERLSEEVRIALINQVAGIAERVSRGREDGITAEEGDTLNIATEEMTSRPFSAAVDDNELTLRVAIYVRGDPWETKADAYAVLIHPLIQRYDYLAAGLKIGRQPRRMDQDWNADEGDATPGKRVVKYAFRFLTNTDDITVQP